MQADPSSRTKDQTEVSPVRQTDVGREAKQAR
jgi:hypothetical protein